MIRRLDVKIFFALSVTVLVPLGFSVYLVAHAIDTSLGLGLNDEIAGHLERSLDQHRKYIAELKQGVQKRFLHLADSYTLATYASEFNPQELRSAILGIMADDCALRKVRLVLTNGKTLEVESPSDPPAEKSRSLPLESALRWGPFKKVEAVYALDESILDAYKRAGTDFATYRALAKAPPDYLEDRFVWVYLAILGVTVALSITIGILWARALAKRIHRLATATESVAAGDLSVRVDKGSDDEVGRLVESFNDMVAELATSRNRIEYLQKISAWQDMARRLAHEIKNPLTPIQLSAQQLKEKYDGSDPKFQKLLEQSTEIISEEVATLRRLTSDFSSFAKLPKVTPEEVELFDFLGECEATLLPVVEEDGVKLTFRSSATKATLPIDRIMFKRVIDNLVRNAVEALLESNSESPEVIVEVNFPKDAKGREIEIRIEDNGPGIPEDQTQVIFDPYFTTKSEGTGLGLAIVKKIVFEHGGRIWAENKPSSGAVFVISLPQTSQSGIPS